MITARRRCRSAAHHTGSDLVPPGTGRDGWPAGCFEGVAALHPAICRPKGQAAGPGRSQVMHQAHQPAPWTWPSPCSAPASDHSSAPLPVGSTPHRIRSRPSRKRKGRLTSGLPQAVAALQRACPPYPPIPRARAGRRQPLRVHPPDDGSAHRCPTAAAPGGHGHRQTAQPGGSDTAPPGLQLARSAGGLRGCSTVANLPPLSSHSQGQGRPPATATASGPLTR